MTLGLMSGTSLDGVDAVAVDFGGPVPRLLGHAHVGFPGGLKDRLLALCLPGDDEIERMGDAGVELARAYARAIAEVLAAAGVPRQAVAAAGVHGQTVRHRPGKGWTLQLNNPALTAELSGVDVVADFRSRDMAAGGQGAPLVPAFHKRVFSGAAARSVVNIGGIANITHLPGRGCPAPVSGFDCGPGNMLMDAWAARHLGRPFDEDGAWGAAGKVDEALLGRLLADPYFSARPPKSTGRELFNPGWLEARLAGGEAPADVQATLRRLTARGIADAIARWAPATREIYLCGGGALNGALARDIQRLAGDGVPVRSTAALGVDPMHVEAMAFAWLAWAFLCRLPSNVPEVTSAAGPRVLGALYPHG
ncbi:MAG: anhydro-N-acetylmuramic acid kinase [Duodenibacillus sp.]|nr:anhydro-N-acetylmuramic acid kinase [Duodenibacillus sp.]